MEVNVKSQLLDPCCASAPVASGIAAFVTERDSSSEILSFVSIKNRT